MTAGALAHRLRFEKRLDVDDGAGNVQAGDWMTQFTLWAGKRYLRGGEPVLAGRLAGTATAIVTLRANRLSASVETDWRAVDLKTGEIFNIRETPRLTDDRAYREMLAETGVAT